MPTRCFLFAKFACALALVVALLLAATGCGGGASGGGGLNDVADLRLPATTDDAGTTAANEATTQLAESGDATSATGSTDASDADSSDTTGSPGPPTPTPLPVVGVYSTIGDFIGSADAITLSRGFRNRMILLSGCLSEYPDNVIETNDDHLAAIIAAVPDETAKVALQAAIGHIDVADGFCGTDTAAWTAAMRQGLAELATAERALGPATTAVIDLGPHPDDATDLRQVSTDIASMNDRLYAALSGRNPIQASNVWYASAHLAHARGLAALSAQGSPPDAIIIGDSTAAFLAPPQALSEQTGISVANLGIDGSRLGTHIAVIDQFLELSPATQTVVWPLTTLMFFRDCPLTADVMVDNLAVQRHAFSPIPELAALPPVERLLGATDPGGPVYAGTTIDDDAATRYPEGWVFGTRQRVNIEVNPDGEQNQVNRWSSTLRNPQTCEAEFVALQNKVLQLRESGLRVVLVAGPLSNDLTSLHPDGRAGNDEVIGRMAQIASDAGVEFVNLSAAVTEDQFRDLTHVNTSGAETAVALLADALVIPS